MNNNDKSKTYLRKDFPLHTDDTEPLRDGSLKENDIVFNTATGYCFYATWEDVLSIKPDTFSNHKKFIKLIPLF